MNSKEKSSEWTECRKWSMNLLSSLITIAVGAAVSIGLIRTYDSNIARELAQEQRLFDFQQARYEHWFRSSQAFQQRAKLFMRSHLPQSSEVVNSTENKDKNAELMAIKELKQQTVDDCLLMINTRGFGTLNLSLNNYEAAARLVWDNLESGEGKLYDVDNLNGLRNQIIEETQLILFKTAE